MDRKEKVKLAGAANRLGSAAATVTLSQAGLIGIKTSNPTPEGEVTPILLTWPVILLPLGLTVLIVFHGILSKLYEDILRQLFKVDES